MDWNVLHVKPRCEKKMAEYCRYYGVEYYLPLRQETKVYQRRKVAVEKPVFPGYVFVGLLPAEREIPAQRETVVKCGSLVRIIEVRDQARFLHEISQVRQALTIDSTLGASSSIVKGKPVRILSGPFQGLEGVVSSVHGVTRVVLNVDMIGQSVRVDADADMIEPLD